MQYSNLRPLIFLFYLLIGFSPVVNAQFENTTLVVQYDSAWTFKNLMLIPLRYQPKTEAKDELIDQTKRIISFSEAMRDKKIIVEELPKKVGPDVATLKVTNLSNDYIMINSGEIVIGGKQDRASGETVLLPPVKDDYFIKTYCVEFGRWSKKEQSFSYLTPAEYTIKKVIDVEKNQAHVWSEIDKELKAANIDSETKAYAELLKKNQSPEDSLYFKFFMSKYNASDSGFAGFIAVTDNRIIAADLYANAMLTSNAFPTILKLYTRFASTVGDIPNISTQRIRSFIEPVIGDAKTRKDYLVKKGTIHYYQGKPIHVVAYGD